MSKSSEKAAVKSVANEVITKARVSTLKKDGPSVKPNVSNDKLNNIVKDLYKGQNNPNKVGSGTTADAVRNELKTGVQTSGKFHSTKANQNISALNNWLNKNPNASKYDVEAAKMMKADLEAAIEGK